MAWGLPIVLDYFGYRSDKTAMGDGRGNMAILDDAHETALFGEIVGEIGEYCKRMDGTPDQHLSRIDPGKAANVLYCWSYGWTESMIKRRLGVCPSVLRNLLVDYSDSVGRWKELGGLLSARSYVRIDFLEGKLLKKLEKHVGSDDYKPDFQDLKNLSIAKTNSGREAMLARGEATSIKEDRIVVTQEDYDDTMREARARLGAMKEAEKV